MGLFPIWCYLYMWVLLVFACLSYILLPCWVILFFEFLHWFSRVFHLVCIRSLANSLVFSFLILIFFNVFNGFPYSDFNYQYVQEKSNSGHSEPPSLVLALVGMTVTLRGSHVRKDKSAWNNALFPGLERHSVYIHVYLCVLYIIL